MSVIGAHFEGAGTDGQPFVYNPKDITTKEAIAIKLKDYRQAHEYYTTCQAEFFDAFHVQRRMYEEYRQLCESMGKEPEEEPPAKYEDLKIYLK